jgi:hypothetical protein
MPGFTIIKDEIYECIQHLLDEYLQSTKVSGETFIKIGKLKSLEEKLNYLIKNNLI